MDRFKSNVHLQELPSGEIVCSNNWPLSVTVELTVKGESGFELLEALGGGPRKPRSLHVLPAFSADVVLAAVARQAPGPPRWQTEYRGAFGAAGVAHDDAVRYKWPYEGEGLCEQSFGSDQSKERFHSAVFGLYEDSQVVAARRGIVLLAESDAVQVCHGDGSVASYGGLRSVAVREGQAVKEREALGLSSAALSFCITLPLGNPGTPKSVPFVFDNGTAAGCVPVVGSSYENAAAHAPAAKNAGPMKMAAKKGGAKVGPKKVVPNKQVADVTAAVPPPPARMQSSGNISSPAVTRPAVAAPPHTQPSGTHSPAVGRHMPPPPPPGGVVATAPPLTVSPNADAEWNGTYASPALMRVKPKPPTVDRSGKPDSPQVQRHAQPAYVTPDHVHAPEGVNPAMMPGVRTAPPSRALHPEYYEPKAPAVDPNAPVVHNSMTPGYQREFNLIDETKRTLDPRRHNPVKNTSKKIAVATPSGSDLKEKLKGFTMF
jgi:hypothetical protein